MIVAILVVFQPDLLKLKSNIAFITSQVDTLLLVNNGFNHDILSAALKDAPANTELFQLDSNLGIAAAQNIGIKFARTKGAKYVLLLDQDSTPDSNMVKELLQALVNLPNAAAVGPVYLSEHQNEASIFTRVIGLCRIKQVCDTTNPIVRTDALIASGCLIPMAIVDIVGDMREELFIDYVDTEWGLRAQAAGYASYAVWSAKMSHQLGSRAIEFMGRNMIVHSPLRRYYQYRNAILLYKMKHIPLNWKVIDASRLFLRAVFYALTNQPRWQNIKMMSCGIWDGLLGKTGKFK